MSGQVQNSFKADAECREAVSVLSEGANQLLDYCAVMPYRDIKIEILSGIAGRLNFSREQSVIHVDVEVHLADCYTVSIQR